MTYSVVPALRAPARRWPTAWEPLLTSPTYDPARRCPAAAKQGAIAGMAMTEKQGGSDVRANTTAAAAPTGAPDPARSTRSPATSGSARRR